MTSAPPQSLSHAREEFLALVGDIRPELHRYCARLTGSVIDGEDIVQETLAKAFYALAMLIYLYQYRDILLRSRYLFFALAAVFLGFSVGFDALNEIGHLLQRYYDVNLSLSGAAGISGSRWTDFEYILEDGSKFIGIISWFVYCVIFSAEEPGSLIA
jgi:hypothetical protein